MCNYAIASTIAHCKYRVLMLLVPFFTCRYLLLNIQVPFSTRQQAIHGTVLFTPDLLTPHTPFPSLPATVPVFWNVSTHFFYSCAHSAVASSTRCHLNRRKLNTYRETSPPSWENGTWQVPSQLSHSDNTYLPLLFPLVPCIYLYSIYRWSFDHFEVYSIHTIHLALTHHMCHIDGFTRLQHPLY